MALVLAMVAVCLGWSEEIVPYDQLGETVRDFRAEVGRPIAIFAANGLDTRAALPLVDRGDLVFGLAGSPSETHPKDLGVDCALYLARRRVDGARAWLVTPVGECTPGQAPAPPVAPSPPETAIAVPVPPPIPPPPEPLDVRRYRNGMNTATAGMVLAPVGVAVGLGALVTFFHADTDEEFWTAFEVGLASAAVAAVGPPLIAAGSIQSARALRRSGVPVSTTCATLTFVFWGVSLGTVNPGAYVASVVLGGVQMQQITTAFRAAGGAPARVSLRPIVTPNQRGLALQGSF